MAYDMQGGRLYGEFLKKREAGLRRINKMYLDDPDFAHVEDLEGKLESYMKRFVEFDCNNNGELGLQEVKAMLEKLGHAKTHMEVKQLVRKVAPRGSDSISYQDFLTLMLGKNKYILKRILIFEGKAGEPSARPRGPPGKKHLSQLP